MVAVSVVGDGGGDGGPKPYILNPLKHKHLKSCIIRQAMDEFLVVVEVVVVAVVVAIVLDLLRCCNLTLPPAH